MIILLADIGGTNARFLLKDGEKTLRAKNLKCADFLTFEDAIEHVIGHDEGMEIDAAAFAVAGPTEQDHVKITNNHWDFSKSGLKNTFGFARLDVVNDLQAAAMSYPSLKKDILVHIGGRPTSHDEPVGFIGLGTGLGSALVTRNGESYTAHAAEGGQQSLQINTQRQFDICETIKRLYPEIPHISIETMISGEGIKRTYDAIHKLNGSTAKLKDGFAIMTAAAENGCPVAVETMEIFFSLLGSACGNYALATGCKGGLYLVSQVLLNWRDFFVRSSFYDDYLDKGRFKNYLAEIPVYLVNHESPVFLGLENLTRQ